MDKSTEKLNELQQLVNVYETSLECKDLLINTLFDRLAHHEGRADAGETRARAQALETKIIPMHPKLSFVPSIKK